jgi:hypothetical protein
MTLCAKISARSSQCQMSRITLPQTLPPTLDLRFVAEYVIRFNWQETSAQSLDFPHCFYSPQYSVCFHLQPIMGEQRSYC